MLQGSNLELCRGREFVAAEGTNMVFVTTLHLLLHCSVDAFICTIPCGSSTCSSLACKNSTHSQVIFYSGYQLLKQICTSSSSCSSIKRTVQATLQIKLSSPAPTKAWFGVGVRGRFHWPMRLPQRIVAEASRQEVLLCAQEVFLCVQEVLLRVQSPGHQTALGTFITLATEQGS